MPVKTASKRSEQDDPIFQSFDADRRKMSIDQHVTRSERDERFYRAGFAAGKASQIVETVLAMED